MKTKIFFLQTFLALSVFFAQAQKQAPAFAISAGISSAMYFDNQNSSNSDLKTGLNAGVSYRLPTGKHWAVEPGLFYVQKGGVETDAIETNNVKIKTTLNYIDLPIDMFYSKRNRFFFGFGPSLDFGFSGKIKAEDESQKIKFGSSANDDLKAFEIGLNLLGGFQFQNNLFIAVNINTGLNNLSNDDSFDYTNSYLGIRLGYMFAKKSGNRNDK